MKGKMKRTLARLLAVIMVVSMMPMTGYGAASADAKWQVGSASYDELQTAVNNVPKNGTIVMQGDPTNNRSPIDANGKSFTIDLSGNTLTNSSSVTWNDADGVTIKNGTLTATAEVFCVPSGSRIILENVTVSSTSRGNAITVESGGELQIVTGTFSATDGSNAIQVETDGAVTWGRQTAIPSDWEIAKTFTAETTTDFQATLDGVGYARLSEALADAQNGSEVVLLKDVLGISINDTGKSFTLDLNKRTVGGSGNVTAEFMITTSGSITVKNGTVICDEPDWGALSVYAGNVTIEDVSFTNLNSDSYAIENAGAVHIKSGTFTSANTDEGAIYTAEGATTTVDTGSIVEPSNWKTASSFTATYNPVVEVRDSETATTGTKYADIETAIGEGAGKYLYLLKDMSEVKDFTLNEPTTFNLNGYTLAMKAGAYINIFDPITLKNGTIKLLDKDSTGGIYIQPSNNTDIINFDDVKVLSELSVLAVVASGNLVLGAGDYEASEGIKTGFEVYESATLTIKDGYATDLPEEEWTAFSSMHIGASIEGDKYVISGLEESYIYKGEPVTPAITVKSVTTDSPLPAQQYNAVFSDNDKPGKAKVTIIGKNNFGGKLEADFNLLPCPPENITVTPYENAPDSALVAAWTHAHADQVAVYKVELYDGYDKLKEVTTSAQQVTFSGLNRNKEYKVVVTPGVNIDNVTTYGQTADPVFGTTDKTDLLTGKNITLSQTSYTYDGTAKKPGATVEGVDSSTYTVSYKNNTNAGTATVTVTGKGDYTGTLTKTFTIKKATLEGVKATGKTVTYNGSAHTVTVSIPSGAKVTYKTSSGGIYSTTKPTRTSAGTTTVYYKVTKANYNDVTGSVKIVVNKRSISSAALSYTKTTYSGSTKKPTVTVKNSSGTKLTKDTHYTVTYASGRTKVGRYKVTITGKGNYTGTITKYFTIVPKAPASASVKLYGYDDVKFSWSKVSNASGYTVYYKKSTASSYTYLTRTTGTSVKKAGLSDGVKYTFKVVPYYKSGDTRYASTVYKTASVYTLKKIGTPTVSKSGTKVKVSWKNISGETGYQISRSTSKTGTNIVSTCETTTGTYKTVKATKGKTYYYKVRAYKTIDGKKIYGPWSTVKSYKRK